MKEYSDLYIAYIAKDEIKFSLSLIMACLIRDIDNKCRLSKIINSLFEW